MKTRPNTGGSHRERKQTVFNFNYQAAPGNPSEQKRIAMQAHRELAARVAAEMAAEIRTGGRAGGGTINAFGMSNFELAPAVG